MKLKWKKAQYGTSESAKFTRWFTLGAAYDVVPQPDSEKYFATVNGERLTERFSNIEDAKAAAENSLTAVLENIIKAKKEAGL